MSIYLGGNNKLKGAYIGKINYRDRQGPCPDGFHVPLFDEATNLLSYMGGFGLMNKEGFKQYLLMPPAGRRMPTDANISGQGSELYYRTCEVSTTSGRSRCIMAYDNYFIMNQYFQSGGASIRPFKNEPVYPDNTWNVLYGTIDNGISHNATLGLISVVRGDNIITIADKNVGATTVYNSGDTLSEANCGGYFQRGNNYMFPFTGNVTTDNTLINASSYGPGNYYYGETYILGTPTWMTSVNSNIWGGTSPNRTPIKRIVIFPDGVTEKQIRPEPTFTPLCFTAEDANSTVTLNKIGTPTAVNLEISTDGTTWTDYTIGNTITLANVGDKVYMRNKSETDTRFSTNGSNFYSFYMLGKIGASGDVTSLLNKNGTTTLSDYCFVLLFAACQDGLTTAPKLPATTLAVGCYNSMFQQCESLTTPPELPATTLAVGCYEYMFNGCTGLTTLPELSATTLANYCYHYMFNGCTNIKLSQTQTGEYQTPYRIPTTGTGTTASGALSNMFYDTGGTYSGTPGINTTYYTSNQVI